MTGSALSLLTIINLLNYLDRYLLAALLPQITKDLALTKEEGGILVSAFVIGYFLFSPIFGYLGDRAKRPVLLAIGVVLWSLATLGTSIASTFYFILFVRILVGVGEASFATISPGYIKDHIHSTERLNMVLAVFYAAIPVGAALAYVLSGFLTEFTSWHVVFIAGGGPGLILAGLLLKLKEHRSGEVKDVAPVIPGLQQIFRVPDLKYAIGGYALQSFALNGIAAFITTLGDERKFGSEDTSKIFGVILVVTGLLGTLAGGKLASHFTAKAEDKIKSLFRFTAITACIGVPCLAGCFLAEDKFLFFALCSIAELMIFASTAPLNSIIVLCAPPSLVTLTQGVTIATINFCGAMLGPIIVGGAADRSSLPLALQLTTVSLAGAVTLWWIGGARRKLASA